VAEIPRPDPDDAPEVVAVAVAPGRVNLIGDHTDYMGGLVLPMAVDLETVVRGRRAGAAVELTSDQFPDPLRLDLPVRDPAGAEPAWGRYVAGVAAELHTTVGLVGTVSSTVPVGSGLSSSAALEVATALALGADGGPAEIAELCRRAETAATGVPCGIMDQLCSAAGIEGHALLIDCATLDITPVPVPEDARIWVVDSGQARELAGSAYADRRRQCEDAVRLVGPLPRAEIGDIEALVDPVLRARARHVRTECDRVRAFAAALRAGDLVRAGELMVDSHASLRDDFEVSTDVLDALVGDLCSRPGVHGARLTGAGFGGCVVALADPGVVLDGREVRPAAGARLVAA
jgi:galactokinase